MRTEIERRKSWIHLSLEEKQTILANIAEEKGIVDNAVEKDFWVSMVLKAVFSLNCSQGIVLKGGTSLGKGWNLIERFSHPKCTRKISTLYKSTRGQ